MVSSGPPRIPSFASKAVINLFCNYLLTYSSCCCRIEGKRRRCIAPRSQPYLDFQPFREHCQCLPQTAWTWSQETSRGLGPVVVTLKTSLVLTQGRTRPLSQWLERGQDWDKCPHSPAEHPQEVSPGRSHRALPRLHKCPSKSQSDFLPGAPGIWLRHPCLGRSRSPGCTGVRCHPAPACKARERKGKGQARGLSWGPLEFVEVSVPCCSHPLCREQGRCRAKSRALTPLTP